MNKHKNHRFSIFLLTIELRKAENKDWDLILELRNEFYPNFYKQDKPISKGEHYQYMEKQELNPQFNQWMIEDNNKIVGYIRIFDNDIGVIVKKEYQNKGIASQALKLAEKKAQKLGISKLVALVKIENEGSKKIFMKNDYKLKMYWLEKKIL